MPLTGKQNQYLRSLGHHLNALVQIGKHGVTESVTAAVDQALLDHELIKIRIHAEAPSDRYDTADAMAAALRTWLERHGGGEGAPARAAFLAALFADERAQIEADIAAGRAELIDSQGESPQVAPMRFISEAALDDLAEPRPEPPRAPSSSRGRVVAVGVALVLAALALWLGLR